MNMQKYIVTPEIIFNIEEMFEAGVSKSEIVKAVVKKTGWGKTKARETVNKQQRIMEALNGATKAVEETVGFKSCVTMGPMAPVPQSVVEKLDLGAPEWFKQNIKPSEPPFVTKAKEVAKEANVAKVAEKTSAVKEGYIYDKDGDQYKFFSKKAKSGEVTLGGSVVRSIVRDYTTGSTTTDISRRFAIHRSILSDILSKLSITHDSLPFTDEELAEKSDVELVGDVVEQRKFDIYQQIEKEKWKATVSAANKWMEFKVNSYEPFAELLDNWTPPKYEPISPFIVKRMGTPKSRAFVVGAFDWHFGAREEARYMWKGKEWNLDAANAAIKKYTQKIYEKVANDNSGFEKCVFLMGGDLYNSLTGYTSNGTQLNNEYSKDTQFEAVMNAMVFFIGRLLEIFPKVECHFVRGNHGGTTDIPFAWAIKNYFRTENRLTFDITSCRTKPVKVGPVLILLDHGASDQTKSLLPANGKAKESYIQSLLLAHPEMLVGVKQKIFVQGDLHHYEQREYNDFEFFMFGALPCGSQYADTKNLRNRARQNCLIIDEDGVEQVIHVYVD